MMIEGHPAVRIAAIESMPLMGERGRCFQEEMEELWEDPVVGGVVQEALQKFSAQDGDDGRGGRRDPC